MFAALGFISEVADNADSRAVERSVILLPSFFYIASDVRQEQKRL